MDIESFDSFESMMNFMRHNEEEANSHLHPQQAAMRDAFDRTVYWVRPYPAMECLIFGVAYSFKEVCEIEAKYAPPRTEDRGDEYWESLSEFVWSVEGVVERRKRGYLWGTAYSILEPRGEIGDTHVAVAYPIREVSFHEAEEHEWQAIQASPLTAATMDSDVLAKHTTPHLIEDLIALDDAITQ